MLLNSVRSVNRESEVQFFNVKLNLHRHGNKLDVLTISPSSNYSIKYILFSFLLQKCGSCASLGNLLLKNRIWKSEKFFFSFTVLIDISNKTNENKSTYAHLSKQQNRNLIIQTVLFFLLNQKTSIRFNVRKCIVNTVPGKEEHMP